LLFLGGIWLGSSTAVFEILDREPTWAQSSQLLRNADEYYDWTTDSRTNVRQRLAEYKPYNPTDRWNRNIIQSWRTLITTADGFFASWEWHNPDFRHVLFNDATELERVLAISANNLPEVNRTYSELLDRKIVLRSDFFRYLIIWAHGGIWADVDTWAQQSFNQWLRLCPSLYPDESLASMESRVGMIVGIECMNGEGGDWDNVAQYIFAAKQGHPVLLELVARIIEKAGDIANRLDTVGVKNMEVLALTGPGLFSDMIGEWIKNRWDASFNLHRDWRHLTSPTLFGDILILPVWAFNAGVGFPNTFGWEDPRVCAGHRFLGSWADAAGW
jgi:mannosyltransferase OCH1-like enzyme